MHLVGLPGLDDEIGILAIADYGHKEKGEQGDPQHGAQRCQAESAVTLVR